MLVHIDGIIDLETLDFTERHYQRQGQLGYIDLDFTHVGGTLKLEYKNGDGVLLSGSRVTRIDEDDTVFNVTTDNTIYHFSKREEE